MTRGRVAAAVAVLLVGVAIAWLWLSPSTTAPLEVAPAPSQQANVPVLVPEEPQAPPPEPLAIAMPDAGPSECPPAVIIGTVTRDGAPAAGADVTLTGDLRSATTRTDAKGAFRFAACAGYADVSARLGEAVAVQATQPKPGETVDLDLELVEGVIIEGTVRDEHQRGVAGGRVWLTKRPAHGLRHTLPRGVRMRSDSMMFSTPNVEHATTTDASGHYAIGPVEPELYDVNVDVSDLHATRECDAHRERHPQIDFDLTLEFTVSGTVVDGEGGPVARAAVFLEGTGPTRTHAEFITDERGRFTIAAAPGNARVTVRHEKYADKTEDVVVVAGRELRITLDGITRLDVEVVDKAGRPLPKITVSWTTDDGHGGSSSNSLATGPDGHTVLGRLEPGPGVAGAGVPGAARVEQAVTLAVAKTTSVRLVVTPGVELAGTVVDSDGKGIAKANLFAQSAASPAPDPHLPPGFGRGSLARDADASTDARGGFVLVLAEGDYRLMARAEGFETTPAVLAHTGERHALVRLTPSPRVTGQVIGADDRPVTSFKLSTQPIENADGRFDVPFFTNRFTSKGDVVTRSMTLRIEAVGYQPFERELDSKELGHPIEVRLTAKGR